MSVKEHIKSLLKEANLYNRQGLLLQAREKFLEIRKLIKENPQLSGLKELSDAVQEKIDGLENELTEVDKAPVAPELPEQVQDLIKKEFAFSEDKNKAAFEGAMALARFGQYEKAVHEFDRLLEEGIMRRVAAKNMLTIYLTYSTAEDAINQFKKWISQEILSGKELKYIRSFLQDTLRKRGLQVELPKIKEVPAKKEKVEKGKEDEEILYISSVSLALQNGPRKGDMVEFDVTVQSGKNISVIISSHEKEIIDSFNVGIRLPDMQCYSPIGLFRGEGVVLGKNVIKDGPKRGDWVLDITVETV